jgi:hypothetical protein
MYRVIKYFTDLQDNDFAYDVNDEYPRKGLSVSPSRIRELATDKNRQGVPLIEEIPDIEEKPEKKTKPTKKADKE